MTPTEWRLAQSLVSLRAQIDAALPHRDKASDGTIGDARHQAEASDHNPNAADVVTAIDITNGPGIARIVEALRASRDGRIAYLIFERRICDGTATSGTGGGDVDPWAWRPYDGTDPHTSHFHLSVSADPKKYDDPRPWAIVADEPHPAHVDGEPVLARGDHGPKVRDLESALRERRIYDGPIDGLFGPKLEQAVNTYKHRHGWPPDGRAGRRVLEALGIGA